MNHKNDKFLEELEEAIKQWEESIKWIAMGWDCIEEYTHDLSFREGLDETILELPLNNTIPDLLLLRITAADNLFREVTVASRLCVWHCDPQYRYYSDDQIELTFKHYDEKTYWYYYRWQPDCPYAWKENDGISFQRKGYGLDFEKMTVSELKDAVRRNVAQMEEELRKLKSRIKRRTI